MMKIHAALVKDELKSYPGIHDNINTKNPVK
jgi:hypothetical protein